MRVSLCMNVKRKNCCCCCCWECQTSVCSILCMWFVCMIVYVRLDQNHLYVVECHVFDLLFKLDSFGCAVLWHVCVCECWTKPIVMPNASELWAWMWTNFFLLCARKSERHLIWWHDKDRENIRPTKNDTKYWCVRYCASRCFHMCVYICVRIGNFFVGVLTQ